jgi:hypothetical protein
MSVRVARDNGRCRAVVPSVSPARARIYTVIINLRRLPSGRALVHEHHWVSLTEDYIPELDRAGSPGRHTTTVHAAN